MSSAERRICVPICETDIRALTAAIKRAAGVGHFIEVRLDCVNEGDLTSAIETLRQQLQEHTPSTIITLRPEEQGGLRPLTLDQRLRFWREHGFGLPASFFDVEFDLAEEFLRKGESVDWSRVICSTHAFSGGVGDAEKLYERVARIPAQLLKVSVMLDDAVDNLGIFKLLERAASDDRKLIAIGMGGAGVPSRILGPSRGSWLTYAPLDHDTSTGPGQLTVSELRDTYHFERITEATEVMGLIGHPIAHSLSPQIHNAAFKSADLDAVYLPFDVRDLSSFMRRMVHPATREIDWRLRGLSVTTPHKQNVMDHLDWIDPAAMEIGAVNTVVIDGKQLKGYNTDALGFINALKTQRRELDGTRCAVIGGGGAARAAVWALLQEGAKVSLFVRDIERAKPLAETFEVPISDLHSASFEGFDVVVNTTVLGMSGLQEQQTPANAAQLRGARLAYDLVYNPTETRFLREAEQVGCETLGGLSMFVAQAAAQFNLWTGREAPSDVMHAAAVEALARI
ncbi:MAG TPA: shikimate dehydrogenase [Pyrinomonadaceae bacterium]|nr:shikimate dehydrogenase [Pyrinomonadaceae bacterium]